jgi:cell wall-associated NlpC family hydrolase
MKTLLRGVAAVLLVLFGFGLLSFGQLQPANTFVYVNNDIVPLFGPNSVSAYRVGSNPDGSLNGSLDELTAQRLGLPLGSPFPTGGTGLGGGSGTTNHIAIAGTFLYASNSGSNNISAFSIDTTTGALIGPVQNPPIASGISGGTFCQPQTIGIALAATPDSRFLYAASLGCNNVSVFRIESNGALTGMGGQSLPGGTAYLKVSPDRRFLAATTGTSITLFSIGTEGALGQGQPSSIGGVVIALDFNCASDLLFAPLFQGGTVAVLKVASDGALSHITGSPFPFNNNGGFALVPLLSPDDLHLFVTSFSLDNSTSIASLNITPGGGGALTQTNAVQLAGFANGMATNQQGTLLYATSVAPQSLLGYSIEPECANPTCPRPPGSLTQLVAKVDRPEGTGLQSVAVFPPKTCFGNLAARQAQKDAGGRYGLGGKGFDYSGSAVTGDQSSGNPCEFGQGIAPCYIKPTSINSRYEYFDSNLCDVMPALCATPAFDFGMDCAGLMLWSFNTVVGATIQKPDGSPAQAKELPIWYEGATFQCSTSQSTFLVNDVLDIATGRPKSDYQHPLDLRPGDLLCFHYSNGKGSANQANHVAMYLGNQATRPGLGSLPLDTIEDYTRNSGVLLYHVDTRSGVNVGRPVADSTSKTNCASQTPSNPCFNFLGYWRPKEPRVAILWEAHSPVSLVVMDPDGNTIDAKTWIVDQHEAHRAAGSLSYNDYSPNGDDMVFSPTLKSGAYLTKVVPKRGAALTDTYSLTVTTASQTITLAENVPISQIPALGYGVESTGGAIAAFIPAAIDINPGESPNSINLRSKGTIPVAMFSSPTFNALTRVDPNSLTFGHTGDEASLAFCNTHGEDVNGDGLPDLVCHFHTQSTGFVSGDTVGVLKGKTVDGITVRGTDSVRIVTH